MGADYKKADRVVLVHHSRTAITANTDTYMAAQQGIILQQNRVCPVHGLVDGFFCNGSQPAGAGETYTYTIYLNGNITAMVVVIGGAAEVSDQNLINGFAVAEGDLISVNVVTSLNAAVSAHSASVRIKC